MNLLFLGTHGQKNWGDELMLHVFVQQLSPVIDQFYINSYAPRLTANYLDRQDVTVFDTKSDKLKLLGYLLRCDALVFGGGNILKELYTAYGGSRYATLGMIDTLTKAARLARKPIYLANIGVGPLETTQGRAMTKRIVERASLTTVRDAGSYEMLQNLQVTTPIQLASDAVFAADRTYFKLPAKRKNRTIKDLPGIKKIGISLCRNISNNDNWLYFIQHLARDILKLHQKNPRLQLVGISMQFNVDNNNDQAALVELQKILHETAPELTIEIAAPRTLQQLAATIDQLDVFVGERLHGLILSVVLGVPVVALEYDVKVTGVIGDLGLSDYGIKINQKFKPNSISQTVQTIARHYPKACRQIAAAYAQSHQQSTVSFAQLRNILQNKA